MCYVTHTYIRTFSAVDPSVASWSPEEVLEEVSNVAQCLKARQTLYTVSADWTSRSEQWRAAAITSLDVAKIQREVNGFINQIDYLEKGMILLESLSVFLLEMTPCIYLLCCRP